MSFGGRDLEAWCRSLVDVGLATAVTSRVSVSGVEELVASAGDVPDASALFDLASLTKPLSATLALVLHQSERLPLSTRVGDVWTNAAEGIAATSLDRLLRHRSGLRRWMPLYATCRDEEEVVAKLVGGEWLQPDEADIYGDLDYILWGLTTERAMGCSYWDLLYGHVLEPLGPAGFAPASGIAELTAECRLTTGREVELARQNGLRIAELPAPRTGEVQDGNCRFLGRPVGQAGVFARASAMMRLAREWCRPKVLLSPELVDRAVSGSGRFALGWFRRDETPAGRELGPSALGHDGFTGGTVWIDPPADLICVVLCHRATLDADLSRARADLVGRLARL